MTAWVLEDGVWVLHTPSTFIPEVIGLPDNTALLRVHSVSEAGYEFLELGGTRWLLSVCGTGNVEKWTLERSAIGNRPSPNR